MNPRFKKVINLPNAITMTRICLTPFIPAFLLFDIFGASKNAILLTRIVSAILFAVISFTDFLDGYIARKRNLVTNFGKLMDPLADKLLVFSALVSLCASHYIGDATFRKILACATIIVIFRELTVTSLRLLTAQQNIVVPANMLGKIKTVSQIAFILIAILEPVFIKSADFTVKNNPNSATIPVLSYISMGIMVIMTIWSGIVYLNHYKEYIFPKE